MTKTRSTSFLISVLFFQQFMGGMAFPISKYGLSFIEPFTFAFYRFVISSAVILLIVMLKNYSLPIEKKDYWKIIGLGILIIPINQTFYLWGQSMTGVGHGSLMFATVPVWIFLAALIHLKEKPGLHRTIGILTAVSGVIIIIISGAINFSMDYLWGDLLIFVAVLAWAYYTIYGKQLVRKYGAIRVTAYALISGSIMYLPFGIYAAYRFNYTSVPLSAWLAVFYMAVGTSIVVYVLWYWVLKYMEASRIAVFHNLQPLIASVVAYFWLNEPLGAAFIIGGIIVLSGVIITEV